MSSSNHNEISNSQCETEICTQQDSPYEDFQSSQAEPPSSFNTDGKPWAKLISKSSKNASIFELMPKEADLEGRYNLVTLGRSGSCEIKLPTSVRISNRHCTIYCKLNLSIPGSPFLEAFIEDESANGTFLKYTKLKKHQPQQLRNGDEIYLVNPNISSSNDEEINNYGFYVVLELPNQKLCSSNNRSLRSQNLLEKVLLQRTTTVIRILKEERVITDFYSFCNEIGNGGYGSVYDAIKKDTGTHYAVKVIDIKRCLKLTFGDGDNITEGIQKILKEAEILRKLSHPNIIKLIDIFSDSKNFYLVMELSTGGDIFDRLTKKGRYSEDEAKLVFKQLLEAIDYLHDRKIAHRDLKPENILLASKVNDTEIKITDFGVAGSMEHTRSNTSSSSSQNGLKSFKTFVGTEAYLAPEVIEAKVASGTYDVMADMWSAGVILYVLFAVRYPISSLDMLRNSKMFKYDLSSEPWPKISDLAKDLIRKLLVLDPKKRLSAKEALKHPWLESVNLPTSQSSSSSNSNPPNDFNISSTSISTMIDLTLSQSDNDKANNQIMPPPKSRGKKGSAASSSDATSSPSKNTNKRPIPMDQTNPESPLCDLTTEVETPSKRKKQTNTSITNYFQKKTEK